MAFFEDCSYTRSYIFPDDLKDLPLQEVKALVAAVEEEIIHFKQENELFEAFLSANEHLLIKDMERTLEKASEIQRTSRSISRIQFQIPIMIESVTTFKSLKSFKSSMPRSDMITSSKGPRINVSERMDLVMREIEDLQDSFDKFIAKSKKTKFNYVAEIEESDIRIKEIQEASEAFERVVVRSSGDVPQKIPAERFVKFMQDWLKNGQVILEKLRLHTISFRLQVKKLNVQVAQRMEIGESVDEADLEKMEIQKDNMRAEVHQKMVNLLEIKHMNSKANMMLMNHKKLLEKLKRKKADVQTALQKSQKKMEMLIDEAALAEQEIEIESKRYSDLKKLAAMYRAPTIMEYIRKKAELYELKKDLKIWRRRQQVQDIGLATYTKMLCHLVGARKARRSWFELDGPRKSKDDDDDDDLEFTNSGSSVSLLLD